MVLPAQQQKEENFSQLCQTILKIKHITKLTDIQQKAFRVIEQQENLVIVAPSGAGKSLIAELIALQSTLKGRGEQEEVEKEEIEDYFTKKKEQQPSRRKSIFLVPLRALAEEKERDFAIQYRMFNLSVHLSISERDFNEEALMASDIIIATYERFKIILSRMPKLLNYVENVIVDEFHLLGNKSRGETLEVILTNLREKVRLILLSATIANPQEIADWLEATLLQSDKRLVPLEYSIKTTLNKERDLKRLILTNLREKAQMLVFSGTRRKAEENAQEYADFIARECNRLERFPGPEIEAFLKRNLLSRDTPGNKLLFELARKGTAFHHAGLSQEVKKTIEELFRMKKIQVLFCTETLGAGVNLPAREVVLMDMKRWNNEWLSRNVFHQIAGRAGRAGYDTYGRCTIFASDQREKIAIMKRYWVPDQLEKERFWAQEYELRFDEVKSQVKTIQNLEKIVLALIYSCKPTFEELLEVLALSFFNYQFCRNENNETIRAFFELLLRTKTTSMPLEELFNQLEPWYPLEGKQLVEQMEGAHFQRFTFQEQHKQQQVFIKNGRLSCDCNKNKILCKHKYFLLKQMALPLRKKVLCRNFSVLDKLIAEGYVKENSGGRLVATTKGIIMAELNVSKERFEVLRDWMIYKLHPRNPSLTTLLFECLKNQPQIEEEEFLGDYREFLQPIYEHIFLRKDFNEILKKNELFEGDLFRVEMMVRELIKGLIPLAEFLGLSALKEKFEQLNLLLIKAILES